MFILSLRTILKLGHGYGYPLDQSTDQHFAIGAFNASLTCTLQISRSPEDELHTLEELLVTKTLKEILSEELLSILCQLAIFDIISGVRSVSCAVLNLAYMHASIAVGRMFSPPDRAG